MRAAVYHGRKDVRIENIPAPSVSSTDVRIRVDACGICGSDIHEYASGPILTPNGRGHPLTGESLPLTLGHEFSGVVTECGESVTGVETGDAVVVNPILYCDECHYCAEGAYHLCELSGFVGLASAGGFAEEVVVSAENVVSLPNSVDAATGALVEPLSVTLHAVRQSGLQLGDTAAVFGAGPIGLGIIRAVRAAGAKTVLVSEPRDERRALAMDLGADVTVDPAAEDAVDVVRSYTDGGGVDVAFEVAGIESTFNQAIRASRKNGTIAVVSIFEDAVTMQPQTAIPGERKVIGTLTYHGGPRASTDFDQAIDMIERGAFDPQAFVTDRIPLDTIVDSGFEPLVSSDEHVKILVEP